MTDRQEILARLRGLHGVSEEGLRAATVVVHDGDPRPKPRPRHGQRRTYSPPELIAAERALATRIRAAVRGIRREGNVAVAAIFYRSTRRKVDGDNLMKLALDAATAAGAWWDDCQITTQAAWVELDPERPRTVLAICDATSTLERRTPRARRQQ